MQNHNHIYKTAYKSPLGVITLACDGDNLVGLWIEGQKYHGATLKEETAEKNDAPVFDATKKWLDRYFKGEKPALTQLPLAPSGGEFRQAVWQVLCEIPYGQIVTYGDIARKVAKKMNKERMSGQAIGGAVGHNPISIIIPCHRVVGASGNLTGYAGGINVKLKLLEMEGVDTAEFFIPKKGTAL